MSTRAAPSPSRPWLVLLPLAACAALAVAAWSPRPAREPLARPAAALSPAAGPSPVPFVERAASRVEPTAVPADRTAGPARAPEAAPASNADAEAERQHGVEQSEALVRLMRAQVRRSALGLTASPEAAANNARLYLEGWRDAVTTLDPRLPDLMSDEVDATLCDAAALPAEQLSWLWLASEEPTFASARGLECVVAARLEHGASEDMVLWTALEAWDAAGMPVSESLEQLGRQTRDPRTSRRLAAIRGERRRDDTVEHALQLRASVTGALR